MCQSHRLEMQQMHDQVKTNKLEQEQRSQIPLPPPPPGRGIPIPHFGDKKGVIVVIVQIWLMLREGR